MDREYFRIPSAVLFAGLVTVNAGAGKSQNAYARRVQLMAAAQSTRMSGLIEKHTEATRS
jgi:hypothetical protein